MKAKSVKEFINGVKSARISGSIKQDPGTGLTKSQMIVKKAKELPRKIMSDTGYMIRRGINKFNEHMNAPAKFRDKANYQQGIDSGLIDPKKQKELDEKIKRGEEI